MVTVLPLFHGESSIRTLSSMDFTDSVACYALSLIAFLVLILCRRQHAYCLRLASFIHVQNGSSSLHGPSQDPEREGTSD